MSLNINPANNNVDSHAVQQSTVLHCENSSYKTRLFRLPFHLDFLDSYS